MTKQSQMRKCGCSSCVELKGLSTQLEHPREILGNSQIFGLELQQSVLWSRSQAAMSKRIAQELSMEEPVKYEDAKSGQEIRQLLGCLEIK